MCIMFWKTSSESHCFWLKPIIHCTFRERIPRSTVCLNVYIVLKNFFWKPLFLLEAHHSVYFDRAHTFFNCIFECVYCFKKLLLKAIASAWSPHLSVLSQRALFVQLCFWMSIMFRKTSSESHCFCLKPTTQCTFTERILHSFVCLNVSNVLKKSFWKPLLLLRARHSVYFHRANILSIVCLNVYNVLKKFFWKPLLLLEVHDSLYFQRAQTLFNCIFECVWCFEKILLKAIASAWSPRLTVLSESANFV